MELNVIIFYTYEGRNCTLYFSSDHTFKKDLSVFSDFVPSKRVLMLWVIPPIELLICSV